MKHQQEEELYRELFSRDPLKAYFFDVFITYHRGIDNAITIDDFLAKYNLGDKIKRRAFRKFYSEEIPVAYVNTEEKKGLYWPTEPRDMKPTADLRKKAMAMLVRMKRLEDMHKELIEPEQLGLSS